MKKIPRINFYISNFQPGNQFKLEGDGTLFTTWHDIVWSSITVGKSGNADLFRFRRFSEFEILYKVFIIYANLQEKKSQITRSSAYNALDSTEKGAISYFLGMSFAKLFASNFLNTPWLIHLEKFRDSSSRKLVFNAGKSRPDLIGLTKAREWIVVEAKGRTNSHSVSTMTKAKKQAQQIVSIGGTKPTLSLASQISFNGALELHLEDPPPDENGLNLEIDINSYLKTYYSPFIIRNSLRWLWRQQQIQQPKDYPEGEYQFFPIPGLGVVVGILKSIIRNKNIFEIEELQDRESLPVEVPSVQPYSIGAYKYPDGLIVDLAEMWSSEQMSLDNFRRKITPDSRFDLPQSG